MYEIRQNKKDFKHIRDQKFTGSQSSIIYLNSIILSIIGPAE